MVTAVALSTTVSLVDAASRVLSNEGVAGVGNKLAKAGKEIVTTQVGNVARNHGAMAARYDRAGSALTSMTAQTTIISRMFIDEAIIDEPCIAHLKKYFHEWYGAQVIAALNLTQLVTDGRSVQDFMSVVQTGHNQRHTSFIGNLAMRRMGQESFLTNYTGENFGTEDYHGPLDKRPMPSDVDDWKKFESGQRQRARDDYKDARQKIKDERDDANHADQKARQAEEDRRRFLQRDVSIKSVNVGDNRIGPMGQLFEVKLSNPNGGGVSITVPVMVQMQPSIVPAAISARFIDLNVPQTLWQRWTMWRAGEYTFFKDFLLQRQMNKRYKSMLKDPERAKAYTDFQRSIAMKDKYALGDITDTISGTQSSNLANSVMVFSEDTVTQAKLDSGIDLHNPVDRQRYFKNTYTMIVAIVDPMHQRVTVYFNGLDGDLNLSYSDFRPNDKSFDPGQFMTALQAFSSNNISRMR